MAVADGGVGSEQAMGEAVLKKPKITRAKRPKQTAVVGTPKEKKPKAARSTIDHPPYFQMVMEAISSLKERTGSSQHAIAKYLEEKYKSGLPPTFKKILAIQLKSLSANGKLTRVKNSYKLPSSTTGKKPTEKKVTTGKTSTNPKPRVTKVKVGKKPGSPKKAKVSSKIPKKPTVSPKNPKATTSRAARVSNRAMKKKQGTPAKPKKAVTASKRARRVAK